MNELNEMWDWLEDMGIATEDELRLITNINGYSLETLNNVLCARTGYRDREQYEINNERKKKMNEKELRNYLKNNIINLNHRDFDLSTLPMGKSQNIQVKVGRKIYLMDVDKSALSITVDLYNELSKVRNAFSKYSEKANLKSLTLVNDCLLSRDLVENFAELEKAIALVENYRRKLYLTK